MYVVGSEMQYVNNRIEDKRTEPTWSSEPALYPLAFTYGV